VDMLILDSDYHRKTGLLAKVASSGTWERVFQARSAILYSRSKWPAK
jgi:hypothetical protein